MQHSEAFLKLVNASKARIRETNVDEVSRRLQAGEKLTLVDVREDRSKGEIGSSILNQRKAGGIGVQRGGIASGDQVGTSHSV